MAIKKEIIRAYTLKNAIAYNGQAKINSVISSLFHEGLKKEEVKSIIKDVKKIISEINKLSLEEQKKEFLRLKNLVDKRKERQGLPKLPNAEKHKGKIKMRISPAPSGPLHIGNAITGVLNFLYAEKYKGKFFVRIEDTNPNNIYPQAYKLIKQDSRWLFKNKAEIITQSKRMKIYYNYAEKLIKKNKAYVCTCSQEEFKKFINQKKNCPCRKLNIKEQTKRWKKMLNKTNQGFKQGEAVLRFKSNMKNKNPAMRDFPLARINNTKHPLQKNKYKVWPLMNLAVTADDIEMKITHIIRGKDHRDNAGRQKMIYSVLEKKYPWSFFIGRYKLKDAELSKTKIRQGIKSGKYKGWDDSNLLTIASLRKKRYKQETFYKLAEHIGLSEVDKVIDKKEFFRLLNKFK